MYSYLKIYALNILFFTSINAQKKYEKFIRA